MLLLTNTPCDMAYEHTVDFSTPSNQFNYFMNRLGAKVVASPNIPIDGYRTQFDVDISIDDTVNYDYCVLYNNYEFYYYFIIGRVQKGTMTTIFVDLDVIQTYYFDMQFNESFVERCHVDRWTTDNLPTYNIEDEGLNYGTKVLIEEEQIINLPLQFIICATSPIGKLKSSGGGGGGTGGDWEKGIPTADMFRYLKGYEGFAQNVYNDSGGVATIGYGVTNSEPDKFKYLSDNQPCSEQICAEVAWELLQSNYGQPIVQTLKDSGITEQKQFDALVDLAYNAGVGRITNADSTLMTAIRKNPTDESYIRPIWEKYIISDAQGNVLEGLKLRRKAECDIYFQGVYEKRVIPKIGNGGAIIGTFDGDGWLPS